MANYSNWLHFIFWFQLVLNLYFLYWFSEFLSNKCKVDNNDNSIKDSKKLLKQWIEEFRQIGMKYKTTKVSDHGYESLYGMYLGPIRKQINIRMLEIGLGCNMPNGPGKSVLVWREYIPNVKLSVLEYDANCAQQFRPQLEQLFVGDQSNLTLLNQIVSIGGQYDVIIDDGGHSRKQQIHSLIGLWPAVKPSGGIYVIEDMHFSYDSFAIDYQETAFNILMKIVHSFVFQDRAFNNFNMSLKSYSFSDKLQDISNSLFSVNCFRNACVLVKK